MYRHLLVTLLTVPLTAWAGDPTVSGTLSVKDRSTAFEVAFSNRDRAVLAGYNRRHDDEDEDRGERGFPPGLAKRHGHLPPGLANRPGGLPPGLARHQRVPDDVAAEPLPLELERRLAPLPSADYVRVKIGKDIAILDKRTHIVLDIAYGLGNY